MNSSEQDEAILKVPPIMKLKCGCSIHTDQLDVSSPDDGERRSAKASLVMIIERHILEKHGGVFPISQSHPSLD